ncbi:hypothetical protein [Actinacidiphila sp. bgisy160]|uniref:hypothetical protein n=1 Tax=Actinacidiphila sp. bgisy160 TaxID=3413796 RepID=UPI003D73AA10
MPVWYAYVEFAADGPALPDEVWDRLHGLLHEAGHSPSVGCAPNGNASVRLCTEAGTAEDAVELAAKIASQAIETVHRSCTVVGLEVMTEAEIDRRNSAD